MSLYMNLWMAHAAIIPSSALANTKPSKKNIISNEIKRNMTATAWAIAARTEPNFLQHILRRGPIQHAIPNIIARTPALTATGAKATIPRRINALVGVGVTLSLLAAMTPTWEFMKMNGIKVAATTNSGPTISPKKRFVNEARGTSPDILDDGSPRVFRL